MTDPWMTRCYNDLTARLAHGAIRRAYGRENEVAEVLRLLASPLPRHPALLGRPSVGKSAVGQAVGSLIARGECPEALRGWRVLSTSPRQLLSGVPPGVAWGGALSQLWERLQSEGPFLLLLNSAHDAAGMGKGRNDESDLADFLSELLMNESGEVTLRVLAEARADRWSYLGSALPAYTGLFVPVRLEEPEGETLWTVINAACGELEVEHGIEIGSAARQRAIELTQRYVVNAAMPGKALALLEEALATHASESTSPTIGSEEVMARFAQRTGLPLNLLDENASWDEGTVRSYFQRRVLGQDLAVEAVIQRLSLLKAGIHDPNRPLGVFLFIGPTGVGKTELAKALANFLFGREDRMVRLNMADYSEFWQFRQLFGDPDPEEPIEVQRGQLTMRLGDQWFTVLLLDEFEKAYFNIYQRFLQLFDEGILVNGAGEEINLRNSIIILTSNLGATMTRRGVLGFSQGEQPETLEQQILRTAEEFFTPEFVNRIDQMVFFHPLSRATMRRIAFRELEHLFQREGLLRRRVQIEWDDSVVDWVVAHGYSERFGARYLRRQIEKSISYPIARALLAQPVEPGSLLRVYVRGGEQGQIEASVVPPQETTLGTPSVEPGLTRRRATLDEVRKALPELRTRVQQATEIHHLEELRVQRDELLAAMARPDFWEDTTANEERLEQLGTLSTRVELVDGLQRALDEVEHLLDHMWGKSDRASSTSLVRLYHQITADLERAELDLFFMDAFDPRAAWITVLAAGEEEGVGEWVAEVVGMYLGWSKRRGFEATVVDETASEGKTLLCVRLRIVGHGAFALLRGETGIHRLVEAAQEGGRAIRHARVAVWPQVAEEDHLMLPLSELQIEAQAISERGRFLKRLRSHVRASHLPTGQVLECTSALALHESEVLALELLRASLLAHRHELAIAPAAAPWGDVVRTYQRHREQGVRDHRTDTVIKSLRHVMSGRIDAFLMAALVRRARG